MEAWTSRKVSGSARQCWLKFGPYQRDTMFAKHGKEWHMYGWESEIDLCHAYGRGWAAGSNRPPMACDAAPYLIKPR